MEQKLKDLMAELFRMKEDEITDDLTMEHSDVWDSLKHMELVLSIEQAFGIELALEEIVAMLRFKDIKWVLKEKGIED